MNKNKIILDLCGGTGAWSKPYSVAGYDVRLITLPENDVRTYIPPDNVYGILAAPPCTMFAISGNRWKRTDAQMIEALSMVDACIRIVYICRPTWWALENPVGKLIHYLGKWQYTFQPYEYGDPWTKRTCIWGSHNKPEKNPVEPTGSFMGSGKANEPLGLVDKVKTHLSKANSIDAFDGPHIPPDWVHKLPPSKDRATLRSITPPGFAKAFFEANQ